MEHQIMYYQNMHGPKKIKTSFDETIKRGNINCLIKHGYGLLKLTLHQILMGMMLGRK